MIATTESPLDDLRWHAMVRDSGWGGRVVTAYRPDAVVDPEFPGFAANVARLAEITGRDTGDWDGYLAAHRDRRAFFKAHGATSSPTTATRPPAPRTSPQTEAEALFAARSPARPRPRKPTPSAARC